jgi:DNA-binding NarL/FixJ family response regulator
MPEIKVVALSMNADRRYVTAMLEAGASGYLLKNAASEELLLALRTVQRGDTYLSPPLSHELGDLSSRGVPSSTTPGAKPLTMREREVLQLIAEGNSSKDIAVALGIAVPTVETHRRQIAEKLNLKTIAELTKYAIREGLTSSEQHGRRGPSSRH